MVEIVVIGILILVALIAFLVMAKFIGLWIRARVSNAPVGLFNLVAMWIRKVPPAMIVDSRITAAKAGLDFSTDQLEAHYLAGGQVADVVLSMIAADKAAIPLSYDRACAIDLAVKGTTKTVLEAVRTSINPAVIDCPGGGGKIDAVARDGIQLRARARVTVRTNLDRFVGGATEETIIARVNEGIVTSIGSAQSHKDVLENPDHISHRVLERGLDANTQFEILSIDIADVDVGQNIGATLQTSQAEADKQVAQAKAEVRRAAAVATEQEMSARTQEMRAKLVEAEAQVPLAIAEAFRNGNLGVMDYTNYRNIVADTDMRTSIAEEVSEEEDDP
ncbi:MAG: flotillin-like protein FloA, partial [Verrucomicrobiales bacterium]|nr:flotillin-like protein FloA [Verrucomicrobiales bacterium]